MGEYSEIQGHSAKQTNFVICGTFVHATEQEPMVILEDHCMGIIDGKVSYFVYFLQFLSRQISLPMAVFLCCCFLMLLILL